MANIDDILHALNKNKIRATYGAIGQALGVPAIAVGRILGSKRPEASWVVSASTGQPSGYSANEIHTDLLAKDKVIKTGSELQSMLETRTTETSRLIGLDLAWNCEKNGSGLATGRIDGNAIVLEDVQSGIRGLKFIRDAVISTSGVTGIAIDAPLIIKNATGGRHCEKELSDKYRRYSAGAYPSNLGMKWKSGLALAESLEDNGFVHLGNKDGKWQIECYPHPAMIEIFGLNERLKYKRKKNMSTQDARDGQTKLANLIRGLENHQKLPLVIEEKAQSFLDDNRISTLQPSALKHNEDGLDAIICLYIAAVYSTGSNYQCFGDSETGYIIVPS